MRARLAIALALLALPGALAGCRPPGPTPPDKADLQAARQAALQLDIRIHRELLMRLEHEEPMAVYVAYRDKVFGWTEEISKKSGYQLKRTALAVRNPKNTPDKWDIEQLEKFDAAIQAGLDVSQLEFGEIVKEGKTRVFRWITLIPRDEDCTLCHGEKIKPDLLKQIADDYPVDETDDIEPIGAYSVRKVLK